MKQNQPLLRRIVQPGNANATLRDFLAASLRISGHRAKALLDSRVVFVNQKRTWMARHCLAAGDLVVVALPVEEFEGTPRVLFEDRHLLVVDKPAGVISAGRNSYESFLRRCRGNRDISAIHRLDRDTTGCLLFSLDESSRQAMIEAFRRGSVAKSYHAVAAGCFPEKKDVIRKPLEGKTAVTRIRVLDANRHASHLQIEIETGRTHQIRKHLSSAGHPIVGDKQYGNKKSVPAEFSKISRHMLHASGLSFPDPSSMDIRIVRAPLPEDFRRCLKVLKLT